MKPKHPAKPKQPTKIAFVLDDKEMEDAAESPELPSFYRAPEGYQPPKQNDKQPPPKQNDKPISHPAQPMQDALLKYWEAHRAEFKRVDAATPPAKPDGVIFDPRWQDVIFEP